MRKISVILISFVSLLSLSLLISCDDSSSSSTPANPKVRVYADAGVSKYFTMGTVSSEGFIAEISWLYVSDNEYSSYVSIEAGEYQVITDDSSDHSSAACYTTLHNLEAGKKYTISFASGSSGYYFMED